MANIPKLILIEGVPGSGKSSVAQLVTLGLQRAGLSARWHHENDRNHPISPLGSISGAGDDRLTVWSRFIEQTMAQDEIVVLESALFQKQLNGFVKARRESEIKPLFEALFALLLPAKPLLVCFRQSSMLDHVEWLIELRGSGTLRHFLGILRDSAFSIASSQTGAALVAHYYDRVQAVTVDVAAQFPGELLILTDAKEDWEAAHGRVFERLGIPTLVRPNLPNELKQKLAGRYKCVDGIELAEILVEGGRLKFNHDGWLELIDLAERHFFIDNRPDEIRFTIGDDGAIRFIMGTWVMTGSGNYVRSVPDRFTYGRVFMKLEDILH